MKMRLWSWLLVPSLLTVAACAPSEPPPAAVTVPKAAPVNKPPDKPAVAAGQNGAAPGSPGAPPADAYVYQADGRRDPFLSALNTGAVDPRATSKRADGLAGLAVSEIAVRGLVLIGGARVAMVQGPDGRNYNVHAGDKLMDGTVKSIVPEGLVIVQDVNDPLSTAKQREVRKLLRSLEEAKQ